MAERKQGPGSRGEFVERKGDMTKESRKQKLLWLEHLLWVLGTWTLLAMALAAIAVYSGLANPLLRRALVSRLETLTGGKVEVRTVSVGWFSLDATVRGLVVHGRERRDTEALLSVEQAKIGLRIDSFWGRRVSLKELILQEPRLHVRVEKDGTSNLPTLARPRTTQNPPIETLLELQIGHLQITEGWLLYNNVRKLVAVEGGKLRCTVILAGTPGSPLYLGTLDWDSIELARRRDVPIPANLSAKFSLDKEGFAMEQAVLDLGRSHFDLEAKMTDLAAPQLAYRYRGWLDLLDLREALRTPEIPLGRVDLRGEGTVREGSVLGKGSFAGDSITLGFQDFHSANLSSRSSYVLDEKGVVLPDFAAYALGGSVKGRVVMRYDGLQFRADTKVQDVRLAAVTPAIDHAGFPIDSLHWDSVISADTVETWHDNFLDFDISARMHWAEPTDLKPGHLPVTGDWNLRYRDLLSTLYLTQGEFETPTTRGTVSGILAPKDSSLDLHLQVGALETWSDFIHAISGDKPGSAEANVKLAGSVQWDGTITGPSGGPTFQGHFRGENIRYDQVALDAMGGDLLYSPNELVLSQARAYRGVMQAGMEARLSLRDWEFPPDSPWSSEINLEKVPLEGLEQLAGWNYPVKGALTGQFHGRGTRGEPALTGNFDLADGDVYGLTFNRLRGQLNVLPDEVRLSNAELRFFAPGTEKTGGAGIVTGNAAYRYADRSLVTELVGASLPLANIGKIQSATLPLNGQITFRLKSSGPVRQPVAEGSFRVVDLQIGKEVIGSFDGDLNSDGKQARLKLKSAMTEGAISGEISIGWVDPMPVDGKISIQNINLDPYLLTALHLKNFPGHGTADGDITVQGEIKHPENLTVDGNFTKLVLTYDVMKLENSGPIHLASTRDSLKITSARLQGQGTNIDLSGSVQFTGRRTLAMKLSGTLDLRLLSAYVKDVDIGGHLEANASFEGTLERPRIIGRMKLLGASARSADFPTGLSNLKGDLIFDANRLFFDNVTGEAGGGVLALSGSVNYSEKPLRYDISAKTDRIRVRYPEGISWLVGGGLRLAGTLDGGLLSGKVIIQRVNLNAGLESAGILVSSSDTGGGATSSFLRNLQFDVEASSTPDARMEWPGAHLEAEANLRVRGTAEHPILLGHIHVLSGDLYFRNNHYRVARGDLNFANPFRLDPVVNVEATTTIQQYEITLNFSGQSSKLSLSYRSDPPLPANDIITLLALGQTSSESALRSGGTTQSGTTGASALLSEAISSQLGGRVERLFGITRFRVDPGLNGVTATGSGQNATARITVEQQVTRNLTVLYESNVNSTQQQVIQVEYIVNRNVSVVALLDQNGTFGIDVKIKKRLP
jgi:translocation and assembly module TamB